MAKVKVPTESSSYKTVYSQFRGVHLTDPYLCDANHSPYSLNLISNNDGLPETRPGWRIAESFNNEDGGSQKIHAIKKGIVDGEEMFILCVGNRIYKWTNAGKELLTSFADESTDKNVIIFFTQHENVAKAFILIKGVAFYVYDGTNISNMEDIAKVPVIMIANSPSTDGFANGGSGEAYEAMNLMQSKVEERFAGDGVHGMYYLSQDNVDSVDKIEVMDSTGEMQELDTTAYFVNLTIGRVEFTSTNIPGESPIEGEDNVYITYSKEIDGYKNKILNCTIMSEYGETGSRRVFLSGNSEYRNYDWWTELDDPTYYPDLNYGIVGNGNTAIMGYSKIGKYQVIIKETSEQDGTIFLRYPAYMTDNTPYFKIETGISGMGAVASKSFVSLIDEPLFLSRTGLYAITSNNITAERTLVNRSRFVDEVLKNEANLENAIAVEWNGYYLLALNSKVYAFNSRSKEAYDTSFIYNCFVWDNIPATCLVSYKGELYFGDESGNVCKLNTDIATMDKYNDNGEAISVVWSTKLDNDNAPNFLKTMLKKGSGITTKPFTRSTYEVFVVTSDADKETLLKLFNRDIFDLNDIDLNRFSLEASSNAKFTSFGVKVKKYESLQIIVKGNALNEGFGIYNIVKQWKPVNYAKG